VPEFFDRLRFVEDRQAPASLAQPLLARQHSIGGDDQVVMPASAALSSFLPAVASDG